MTHDTVGIAVAQFAPTASRQGNLADIDAATRAAAARGARIVVFPEYSSYFVDPFDASLAVNAEDLDGLIGDQRTKDGRRVSWVIERHGGHIDDAAVAVAQRTVGDDEFAHAVAARRGR